MSIQVLFLFNSMYILDEDKITINFSACNGDKCVGESNEDVVFRMGEKIVSPNKKASLMLQKDGNLVLKCQTTDKELWTSGTSGVDVVLKAQVTFLAF